MDDRRYFVDIFEAIVDRTQELYDPDNLEKPYYLYGHYLDVLSVLIEKDKSDVFKFKKYPLIILIQDFKKIMVIMLLMDTHLVHVLLFAILLILFIMQRTDIRMFLNLFYIRFIDTYS